jgi:hypothetical protein
MTVPRLFYCVWCAVRDVQLLHLLATAARAGVLRPQSWFDAPFAPKLHRLLRVVVASASPKVAGSRRMHPRAMCVLPP